MFRPGDAVPVQHRPNTSMKYDMKHGRAMDDVHRYLTSHPPVAALADGHVGVKANHHASYYPTPKMGGFHPANA